MRRVALSLLLVCAVARAAAVVTDGESSSSELSLVIFVA
jgi:hypothetical protein